MGRWADIRTRVRGLVGDTTEAEAQSWILDAARELNGEARLVTQTVAIGTTTSGTGAYVLSATTLDLYSLLVDGTPYTLVTPGDVERIDGGISYLRGSGGVFAEDYDATGALQIELRPVPDESGLAITGRSVMDFADPTWASADPLWPKDFDQIVVHGAASIGVAEKDGRLDLADWYRQRFLEGIRRAKSRRSSRVGKGAVRIGIEGVR